MVELRVVRVGKVWHFVARSVWRRRLELERVDGRCGVALPSPEPDPGHVVTCYGCLARTVKDDARAMRDRDG